MIKLILPFLLAFSLTNSLLAQDAKELAIHKPLLNFDDMKPVFKLKDEQLTNKNGFMRYIVLTGYRDGVEPIKGPFNSNFRAQVEKKETGTHRIKMYNLSVVEMFTGGIFNANEVTLEVKDPSKYRYDATYGDEKKWLRKNGYCYEMMMPTGVIKTMDIVRKGMSMILNVKWDKEKRTVDGKEKLFFRLIEIN